MANDTKRTEQVKLNLTEREFSTPPALRRLRIGRWLSSFV